MITGKQRCYLKKMVHALEPTVYMGKAGLTENVLQEMDDYLRAHELLKVKLQDGCVLDSKEEMCIRDSLCGCAESPCLRFHNGRRYHSGGCRYRPAGFPPGYISLS